MSYRPGVSIITCTGDRPEAFALCNWYVGRQTYTGPMQWIVVNDGVYTNAYADLPKFPPARRITETRIFPEPKWKPGQNTLARNLLAAIPEVKHEIVLFAEDDDFYARHYVAIMAELLKENSLVGDPVTPYYHIPSRRYRTMRNRGMSSLAQTGIRAEFLPVLAEICRTQSSFIDSELWRRMSDKRLLSVGGFFGMKGLPGRPGIGIGHRPDSRPGAPAQWIADPDLEVLRANIGDDVELYREWL